MVDLIYFLVILFILGFSILSSRSFYFIGLRSKYNKLMKRLHLERSALDFYLDHIIYFIQIPCQNPHLNQLARSELFIKQDIYSLLYPNVTGLKVYARLSTGIDYLVAYVEVEKIGLPTLSEFISKGTLSTSELQMIKAYYAMSSKLNNDILDEVYKKITS